MEANFKRLYMLKMKARYAKAKTRKERSALIDEAVAMTHYSRKYVIRLLNGSRRHRKHRGRKPSYSGDAHQLLIRIWRAEGYMCPLYLKSIIESAIRDYEELGHDVPPALADELTRMSASTMYRILRPHHIRRTPNKRSGNKASLAAQETAQRQPARLGGHGPQRGGAGGDALGGDDVHGNGTCHEDATEVDREMDRIARNTEP